MKKAHILVVEDEGIVAIDLQNRLERLGYQIPVVVSSGEEAIEQAAASRPDLVLMDIMLKGELDGVAAAKEIRTRFDIPVVYLTAYSDEDTLQRAKITQPFGYILKPFEVRELHTTIEMSLYKHRLEKKLRESERWLATTLKSIGEAVIAADAEGRVTFMNPVAERLTGWPQSQALGQALTEVFKTIQTGTEPPSEETNTVTVEGRRTADNYGQTILLARDGKERVIDHLASPLRDEQEKIAGTVLVFRDVTERRQVEAEREALIAELDAFARTVAHDLQTPLARIVGFAEVLTEEPASLCSDETVDYLRIIARNGRKMSNIIEALLLLAGVRKRDVSLSPLDMASIVSEAQQRLAGLIDQYRAAIIKPEKWPVALGYAPWVEEVWVNYLSNAIKYGGRPPRVELGAAPQADGTIRFWIRDNGSGLCSADQARLFTPFTRLPQAQVDGHGLGLSIVRRIVERLGGEVGVESENIAGRGCIFSFTLPQAEQD